MRPLSSPLICPALLALVLSACGDKDTGPAGTVVDADGDGFPAEVDCDDADPAVFPGAEELCNQVDDDCDEAIDEDPAEGPTWYIDVDGDGFGADRYTTLACSQPEGWVADATDCDDLSAASHPGADEICDELDNDCDGNVDESVDDAPTWYVDADGDGYGDPDGGVVACSAPDIYVTNADDCDDSNPDLSPDTVWYGDVDGDGYGGSLFTAVGCEQPDEHTATEDDCDDRDPAINPEAEEVCDDVDNDCDGTVDGAEATDALVYYQDDDGDGYGIEDGATAAGCSAPDGYAAEVGDCDDADEGISPGSLEACGDGVDNDCDGVADAWCEADLAGADAWFDGVETGGYSGYRLSASGDLDGDGQADLAVGAYGATGAGDLSGMSYVLLGPLASGTEGSLADAPLSVAGANNNDYSGTLVQLGGDATGDGTDDLAIGAWGLDTDTTSVGGAYLFTGPVTGALSVEEADYVVTGVASLDYMGQYVALPGHDLTGDGQGDFVVGVSGDDAGGTAAGALVIFAGPVSGTEDASQADARVEGAASGSYVGYSLAVGDVDGDGSDDLLVGASGQSAAYLVYGPVSGTRSVEDADVAIDSPASDGTGSNVLLGDFDGDGAQDLALGCKYVGLDSATNVGAWRVLAAPLAATMSTDDAVFTATETTASEYLGAQYTQAAAGDLDGDGIDELVMGAPSNDLAGATAGAIFVFAGPLSGTVTVSEADLSLYGASSGDAAGYGVALGDLDGDGALDLAIGARGHDSGTGRTYLLLEPGF